MGRGAAGREVRVAVQCLGGEEGFTLVCSTDATALQLKQAIQRQCGIPVQHQRVVVTFVARDTSSSGSGSGSGTGAARGGPTRRGGKGGKGGRTNGGGGQGAGEEEGEGEGEQQVLLREGFYTLSEYGICAADATAMVVQHTDGFLQQEGSSAWQEALSDRVGTWQESLGTNNTSPPPPAPAPASASAAVTAT